MSMNQSDHGEYVRRHVTLSRFFSSMPKPRHEMQ